MNRTIKATLAVAAIFFTLLVQALPRSSGDPDGNLFNNVTNAAQISAYRALVVSQGGNEFLGSGVGNGYTVDNPMQQTGFFSDWVNGILGGNRDFGKWLCDNCDIISTPDGRGNPDYAQFITSVINPALWGLQNGYAWRPGDHFAICNGTYCIVLVFGASATSPWIPKMPDPVKYDDGKGYKNPRGNQTPAQGANGATRVTAAPGPVNLGLFDFVPPTDVHPGEVTVHELVVVPAPPPPDNSGSGGGGGGGCGSVAYGGCFPHMQE